MDRFNDDNDLIELGSVTDETKGLPQGPLEDQFYPITRVAGMGLSDD